MNIIYDKNNVFAKILRGEIPCNKIAENNHALAFMDTAPLAPIHVLIIPKGAYVSSEDFFTQASATEIADFYALVAQVGHKTGVAQTGYRLIANTGSDGGQEVMHFHMHLLGGKPIGSMVSYLKS